MLVDDPSAHLAPSQSSLQKWNAERIAAIKAQVSLGETSERKEKAMSRSMTAEAMKKRKEREEKRAAAARAKAQAEGEEGATETSLFAPPPAEERPSTPSTETGKDAKASSIPYTVTVPASSPATLGWYSSEGCSYSTIEEAKSAGIWTYPADLHERAKCGVFRDLWEKGYFMGGGIRFGGDYLVYPGRPFPWICTT